MIMSLKIQMDICKVMTYVEEPGRDVEAGCGNGDTGADTGEAKGEV